MCVLCKNIYGNKKYKNITKVRVYKESNNILLDSFSLHNSKANYPAAILRMYQMALVWSTDLLLKGFFSTMSWELFIIWLIPLKIEIECLKRERKILILLQNVQTIKFSMSRRKTIKGGNQFLPNKIFKKKSIQETIIQK